MHVQDSSTKRKDVMTHKCIEDEATNETTKENLNIRMARFLSVRYSVLKLPQLTHSFISSPILHHTGKPLRSIPPFLSFIEHHYSKSMSISNGTIGHTRDILKGGKLGEGWSEVTATHRLYPYLHD